MVGLSQGCMQGWYYLGTRGEKAHHLIKTCTNLSNPHDAMMSIHLIKRNWLVEIFMLLNIKKQFMLLWG